MTRADIEKWKDETEELKRGLDDDGQTAKFTEWVDVQQRKVAPGFNFGSIMTPTHNVVLPAEKSESKNELNEGSELDQVFGKVSIGE